VLRYSFAKRGCRVVAWGGGGAPRYSRTGIKFGGKMNILIEKILNYRVEYKRIQEVIVIVLKFIISVRWAVVLINLPGRQRT